jgi:chromosome segregation ATPase
MCEIREEDSMDLWVESLQAENEQLRERCKALEDVTRSARGKYSEAKWEVERLRDACVAARAYLHGHGTYTQAERVLGLIRKALDGVAPPVDDKGDAP